jgi:WXG100 family type VII secretion target
MSGQAIVNPQELEQFAKNLKQFNSQLQTMTTSLNGQFRQLGDTWRDQQHARFAQEFQQTMQVIQRFLKISEEHIPFLLEEARLANEYLKYRKR